MSLSKHQLSAALKRKYFDLNEKITILDYTNEHPKMGCPNLAEHLQKQPFQIFWKTVKTCEGTTSFSREATKRVSMESIM